MSADDEDFWTIEADVHLLNSLRGLRPIGLNHNFSMIIVAQRFNEAMRIKLPISKIRDRLKTLYDFDAAEKLVGEVTFPNENRPFQLPAEYRSKIDSKKSNFETNKDTKENEPTPKPSATKNTKTPKKSDVKPGKSTPPAKKKISTRASVKNSTPTTKKKR